MNVAGQPTAGPVEQFGLAPTMFEVAGPTICHTDCVQVATMSQLCTGLDPYSHCNPSVEHAAPEAGVCEGHDGTSPLSPPLLELLLPEPLLPAPPLLEPVPLLLPLLALPLLAPPLPLAAPLLVPPAPLLLLPTPPSVSPVEKVAPPQATGSPKSGTTNTISLAAHLMARPTSEVRAVRIYAESLGPASHERAPSCAIHDLGIAPRWGD